MKWNPFDADYPDPNIEKIIDEYIDRLLLENHINKNEEDSIKEFAKKTIENYTSRVCDDLNKTIIVHVFKPSEFDSNTSNDDSLKSLMDWLSDKSFEWRNGSRSVQLALNIFPSAGSKTIKGK